MKNLLDIFCGHHRFSPNPILISWIFSSTKKKMSGSPVYSYEEEVSAMPPMSPMTGRIFHSLQVSFVSTNFMLMVYTGIDDNDHDNNFNNIHQDQCIALWGSYSCSFAWKEAQTASKEPLRHLCSYLIFYYYYYCYYYYCYCCFPFCSVLFAGDGGIQRGVV